MKKLFAWILALLLLVVVIGHFLYPVLSDQLARRRDAEMMQEYREKTSAMGKEQREKLFAEAAEWNAGLEEIRMEDIFTAGITRTTRDYQNHMNVHSGIIAELVIPDIGVSLPEPGTRGRKLPAGGRKPREYRTCGSRGAEG